MTRLRKVVPSSEVAHLWANKAQDEARTTTGNFYFTGPTLYSYGRHYVIAHHLDGGLILWNSESRSNTTNSQKSDARSAMTQTQLRNCIYINGMSEDTARRIDRAGGKKVFDSSVELQIRTDIETLAFPILTMRSIDRMRSSWVAIQQLDDNAERLATWFKSKKWKRALPDGFPVDKELRNSILRKLLKEASKRKLDQKVFDTNSMIGRLERAIRDGYQIEHFLEYAIKGTNEVKVLEQTIGKATTNFKRLSAELAPLNVQAKEAIKTAALGKARTFVLTAQRLLEGKSMADEPHFRYNSNLDRAELTKARDLLGPETGFEAVYDISKQVLYKLNCWWTQLHESQIMENIATVRAADSSDREIRDSLTFINAKNYSGGNADIQKFLAEEFSGWVAEMKKRLAATNAEKIQRWLSGEGVTLDYQVETLVRIKGGRVETSRGATVSLDEAIRLCRMARRCINNGGKDWTTPEQVMPKVGPYAVSRIGADGSATIGCHEFSAEVGMAAIAMLEGMSVSA